MDISQFKNNDHVEEGKWYAFYPHDMEQKPWYAKVKQKIKEKNDIYSSYHLAPVNRGTNDNLYTFFINGYFSFRIYASYALPLTKEQEKVLESLLEDPMMMKSRTFNLTFAKSQNDTYNIF